MLRWYRGTRIDLLRKFNQWDKRTRCQTPHVARRLRPLGLDARLNAGHFVTPYRMAGNRGKNDANDAEPGHEEPSGLFMPGEGSGHWPDAPCKGRRSARPRAGRTCGSCR